MVHLRLWQPHARRSNLCSLRTVLLYEAAMDSKTALTAIGINFEMEAPTLVARAQAGDSSAFEIIYREHCSRVFGICMRMLADRSKAEELTQRIFVRAWVKLNSFRAEGSFSSWLYRLSVNMVIGELRLSQGKDSRTVDLENVTSAEEPRQEPRPDLQLDLERAIATVPPQARVVFVLHDIEGYKHEEIAEAMDVTVGTCKSQLFRARRILREALAK